MEILCCYEFVKSLAPEEDPLQVRNGPRTKVGIPEEEDALVSGLGEKNY